MIRIDFLTFTVHGLPVGGEVAFWREMFGDALGDLIPQDFGGMGYQLSYSALSGAKVFACPRQEDKLKSLDYFTVVLPGQACGSITPDVFRNIFSFPSVKFSRIDLAFDGAPFQPGLIYDYALSNGWQGVCKRSGGSLTRIQSPFQAQDTGDAVGTDTVYFGGASSRRRIRIYNKHGYTRIEFQLRDEWAEIVARLYARSSYRDWLGLFFGLVRRFVHFPDLSEWLEFFNVPPSDIRVFSARVISFYKLKKWIDRQVSPALHVLQADIGAYGLHRYASDVDTRRLRRYASLLSVCEAQGV